VYKVSLILLFISLFGKASLANAEDVWDINGYLGISTDYIYRGLAYSVKPTPRANVFVGHNSGLFLNTWISRDDIAGLFGDSNRRDTEFEFTLGYNWQFDEQWSLSASHARFEFHRIHQPADHDYRETRLSLNYEEKFTFFASHADSVWNTGNSLTTISMTTRHALPKGILAEAELGWFEYGVDANADFPFLRLSTGKALTRNFSANVEFHYSGSNANRAFDSSRTGGNWVGVLNYHF